MRQILPPIPQSAPFVSSSGLQGFSPALGGRNIEFKFDDRLGGQLYANANNTPISLPINSTLISRVLYVYLWRSYQNVAAYGKFFTEIQFLSAGKVQGALPLQHTLNAAPGSDNIGTVSRPMLLGGERPLLLSIFYPVSAANYPAVPGPGLPAGNNDEPAFASVGGFPVTIEADQIIVPFPTISNDFVTRFWIGIMSHD